MTRTLIYDAEVTREKDGKPWQYKIQHFSEWEEFAAAPKLGRIPMNGVCVVVEVGN